MPSRPDAGVPQQCIHKNQSLFYFLKWGFLFLHRPGFMIALICDIVSNSINPSSLGFPRVRCWYSCVRCVNRTICECFSSKLNEETPKVTFYFIRTKSKCWRVMSRSIEISSLVILELTRPWLLPLSLVWNAREELELSFNKAIIALPLTINNILFPLGDPLWYRQQKTSSIFFTRICKF